MSAVKKNIYPELGDNIIFELDGSMKYATVGLQCGSAYNVTLVGDLSGTPYLVRERDMIFLEKEPSVLQNFYRQLR